MTKVHLLGTKNDRKARQKLARSDDQTHQSLISTARKAIYENNFDVDSAMVERMLKPQSLVPTSVCSFLLSSSQYSSFQNAFSDRLSRFGLNFYLLFLVDLLHEVELGVWRALFIHLLRILEAADENLLHELDRR
jgi:hypothetical protein